MIGAAGDFDLIEIEGDAAFLSRPVDGDATVAATTQAAVVMHRAFHIERQHVATNLCPCDGCVQADNLKLKFVAHVGEVATQTISERRKLVGIDVILVHRLLKNPLEAPEYVLFSEELYRTGDGALSETRARGLARARRDRTRPRVLRGRRGRRGPAPSAAGSRWLGRLGRTLAVAGRGLPYMVGRRRRRRVAAG